MLPYPLPKKRCRVLHVELTASSGSPPFLIPIVWWLIFKRPGFHLMSQIPQCQSLNIYDVNKQGPKKYVFVPHVFKRHQNIYIYISFLLMFFVVGHKQQVTFGHDFKRKNANLPLPWESHSKTMYSVVMQKNVCDFPNFKGESPPHPRTIAPTSWDPNTAEPTLAPWPWSSCHGDGRENGVSAPLSPSHRCRRHSSPWSTNPLKGTGRP